MLPPKDESGVSAAEAVLGQSLVVPGLPQLMEGLLPAAPVYPQWSSQPAGDLTRTWWHLLLQHITGWIETMAQ